MVQKIEKIITSTFYNELFDEVQNFIVHNRNRIEISKCGIQNINFVSLDDLDVRRILATKRSGSELKSILQVVATVEAKGRTRYGYESDSGEVWLHVTVTYTLDDGFQNFKVVEVELSDHRTIESDFNASFVPIISSKDLDNIASMILKDYQPEVLENPGALDIPEFLRRVGVDFIEAKLSTDQSIFGEIVFKDTTVQVFDEENQPQFIQVVKGTIVVDPHIKDFRNQGSYNNTVVHELVHWLLHKNYQEVRMLTEAESKASFIDKASINSENWSQEDWMEWHANSIAPRLLMPKKTTREKVNQLLTDYSLRYSSDKRTNMFEQIIDDLAEFFHVSRLAAKIRLQQLGYHEFEGIYNFVGDKYLRSYSCEMKAMTSNQTFTISFNNACMLNWKNENFKEIMNSDRYVYVDSHFCLNNSKYVNMVEYGIYAMTDYAYEHMDECCLLFDIFYKNDRKREISITTFNEYIMYRGKTALQIEVDFSEFIDIIGDSIQVRDARLFEAVSQINAKMPSVFCSMLVFHRDRKELSQEELAEASGISLSTVQRFETDPLANRKLEKLMGLTLGMKLYPDFSFRLIEKSGTNFRDEMPTHGAYKMLLRYCYHLGAYECNQKLKEMGIPEFWEK